MEPVSRRKFIGSGAAVGAGALFGRIPNAWGAVAEEQQLLTQVVSALATNPNNKLPGQSRSLPDQEALRQIIVRGYARLRDEMPAVADQARKSAAAFRRQGPDAALPSGDLLKRIHRLLDPTWQPGRTVDGNKLIAYGRSQSAATDLPAAELGRFTQEAPLPEAQRRALLAQAPRQPNPEVANTVREGLDLVGIVVALGQTDQPTELAVRATPTGLGI